MKDLFNVKHGFMQSIYLTTSIFASVVILTLYKILPLISGARDMALWTVIMLGMYVLMGTAIYLSDGFFQAGNFIIGIGAIANYPPIMAMGGIATFVLFMIWLSKEIRRRVNK